MVEKVERCRLGWVLVWKRIGNTTRREGVREVEAARSVNLCMVTFHVRQGNKSLILVADSEQSRIL